MKKILLLVILLITLLTSCQPNRALKFHIFHTSAKRASKIAVNNSLGGIKNIEDASDDSSPINFAKIPLDTASKQFLFGTWKTYFELKKISI